MILNVPPGTGVSEAAAVVVVAVTGKAVVVVGGLVVVVVCAGVVDVEVEVEVAVGAEVVGAVVEGEPQATRMRERSVRITRGTSNLFICTS
jgi:hypothetical protein